MASGGLWRLNGAGGRVFGGAISGFGGLAGGFGGARFAVFGGWHGTASGVGWSNGKDGQCVRARGKCHYVAFGIRWFDRAFCRESSPAAN